MKRFLLALVIIFLTVLVACNSSRESHNYDSIPYEEYKEFNIDGIKYKVFMPEDINQSLDYAYYDLNAKSNKEEWLINAYVDLEYKTSISISSSKELLDKVYELVSTDSKINDLNFIPEIKKSDYYEIENIIFNPNKEDLGCGVFITYITILVRTTDKRFYLSIPVYEKIIKTKDNNIADPFTDELISIGSFNQKYL